MAETAVKVYYGNLMMLPDVSRVLACLHEKDVKFELININKGHLPVPMDFLKLQEKATNRVPGPAFEDGRKILFESRAICRHLAEKYAEQGNKHLLGRDPLERASIEQWLRSEEHSFDPPSWTLVFHLAFAASNMDFEPNRFLIQESERKLSEVLDVYNQRLGESKYLAGNEFSLADLSHLPNSHYIANSKEWSYLITSRKYVKKWWKKISERTSWLKAVKTVEELHVEGRRSLVGGDSKSLVPHQPDAQKNAKSIEKVADKPPSKSDPPHSKPLLPAHQPSKFPTDPILHEPETHQLTQKSMQNSKPFESVSLPATQAKVAPLSEPPPGAAPHGSKARDSHQPPTQPSPIEKAAKSTLPELAPSLPTQSKTITPTQPDSPQSLGSPTQKSQVKKPAKGPKDERIPYTLEPASLFTPKSEFPKREQRSMETAAGQKTLEQVRPPQTPNLQKDTTNVIPEAPEAAWKSMEEKAIPTLPKPALVSKTEPEAYQRSTTSKDPDNKRPEPPKPAEKFTEKIESSMVHEIQAHGPRTDQFKRKTEPVKPEQGSIDKIASSTSRKPVVVPTTQPEASQSSTPSADPLRKKTETLKFSEKYMENIESSASPEPTATPTTQPEAPRPAKLPSDPLNTIPAPPRPAQEFEEKVSLLTPVESAPAPQPEASQIYRPLSGSVRQGPQAPQPTNTSMKERKGPVSPQPASLSTPQLDPLVYEKVVDQTPIESASLATEPLTGLTTQKPEVPQYEPYPLEKTAAKAPLEEAPSKTPRSDDKPSSRAGSSPSRQADQSSPSGGQQSSQPRSITPPS